MVSDEDKERFKQFCSLDKETGCIEWTGAIRTGYGLFRLNGKTQTAHRISWLIYRGPINGQLVLHKCDNKKCVNPDHLFLGTQKDNVDDMVKKKRNVVLKGELNPNAKLNTKKVKQIRELYHSTKTSFVKLAKQFEVSPKLIELVVKKEAWKDV